MKKLMVLAILAIAAVSALGWFVAATPPKGAYLLSASDSTITANVTWSDTTLTVPGNLFYLHFAPVGGGPGWTVLFRGTYEPGFSQMVPNGTLVVVVPDSGAQ